MFILSMVIYILTFLVTGLVLVLASCFWLRYGIRRYRSEGTPISENNAEGPASGEHTTARRNPRFPDRPSLDDILAGTAPNQHVEPLLPSRSALRKRKRKGPSRSSATPSDHSQVSLKTPSEIPPIVPSSVASQSEASSSSRVASNLEPDVSATPGSGIPRNAMPHSASSDPVVYASAPISESRSLSAFPSNTDDSGSVGPSFWEHRSDFSPKQQMDADDRSILANDDLWERSLIEARMYEYPRDRTYWLAIKFAGINLHHKQVTPEEFTRHSSNPRADRRFIYSYYSAEIMKIVNNPQLEYAYILDGKWKMNVLRFLQFESPRHLKAHINYLFRTDRVGKYVTDLTPQCYMAFFGKTDKVYPMGIQKNRKLAGNILYRDLMADAGESVDHLRMQLVEISVDEEMIELSDDDRMRLFTDYIARRERIHDGWQVMAYVEHSDLSQDRVYHIHTVLRRVSAG